jgi:uncharacterized delta-60 repeat protein
MKKIILLTFLLLSKVIFAQDGTIESTFNIGTGANGNVYLIKPLPNSKIIIGGQFTRYNENIANGIARLNSDGSFDTTFNSGTGVNFMVHDALIEDDGKIIIVGEFSTYNGVPVNNIVRLNTDGTLDTSFNTKSGGQGIYCISKQNNKYIISGSFSDTNNAITNHIARLNYDGTTDLTFYAKVVSGSIATTGISKNSVLSDGKIMIVGTFNYCQNVSRNNIARLNSDGTLDTTFDPGTGASGSVYSLAVQEDGKCLIGGKFANYNDSIKPLIVRINIDGSLDTSFSVENGYGISPSCIQIQKDGKIIVGGWSTDLGENGKYLTRLNPNGTFDTNFTTGSDFDNPINILSFQEDGKILVGGWFTTYNNFARNKILRLNNQNSILSNPDFNLKQVAFYPNPTKNSLFIDNPSASNNLKILLTDISGRIFFNENIKPQYKSTINLTTFSNGIYFLKLDSEGKSTVHKIIKN